MYSTKTYLKSLLHNTMKKIALIIIPLLFTTLYGKSQHTNTNIEKSLYGLQVGFLGIWGHNELSLSNTIALRSEIGFDSGIWGGSFYDKVGFLMTPVITVEPRIYYNITKRKNKLKNTSNNGGNFVSLYTSYHPSWFVISNYNNVDIISDISVIPTWGIRRNLGFKFNFETGFGIGYRYIFAKNAGYAENESRVAINLHLRIGYTF